MTRRIRLNRWAALVVATGVAAAVFGYLLLIPARGEVLLLLTAIVVVGFDRLLGLDRAWA